jgi:hypothetical protein
MDQQLMKTDLMQIICLRVNLWDAAVSDRMNKGLCSFRIQIPRQEAPMLLIPVRDLHMLANRFTQSSVSPRRKNDASLEKRLVT